ncbi:hypothetical protein BJ742DRAFT_781610 [Cladochytrium replicatum]|nr:hypothetical protein BJ742DRAFT_781610 [Cladochytrium replicatum]
MTGFVRLAGNTNTVAAIKADNSGVVLVPVNSGNDTRDLTLDFCEFADVSGSANVSPVVSTGGGALVKSVTVVIADKKAVVTVSASSSPRSAFCYRNPQQQHSLLTVTDRFGPLHHINNDAYFALHVRHSLVSSDSQKRVSEARFSCRPPTQTRSLENTGTPTPDSKPIIMFFKMNFIVLFALMLTAFVALFALAAVLAQTHFDNTASFVGRSLGSMIGAVLVPSLVTFIGITRHLHCMLAPSLFSLVGVVRRIHEIWLSPPTANNNNNNKHHFVDDAAQSFGKSLGLFRYAIIVVPCLAIARVAQKIIQFCYFIRSYCITIDIDIRYNNNSQLDEAARSIGKAIGSTLCLTVLAPILVIANTQTESRPPDRVRRPFSSANLQTSPSSTCIRSPKSQD